MTSSSYTPPKVWTWDKPSGGAFASINRPVAGPTQEKDLPIGKHPLQLYSLATPNGQKVTILLEELMETGHDADYDAWPIHIREGDQFGSGFIAVNPNSKIPALMDYGTTPPTRVFESGSILIYLAEKFGGPFLPMHRAARAECLSWLMWQMGSTPFLAGGFGHFYAYAPEKFEYPISRYAMEVKRQLDVLNRRLADNAFLAGEAYTLADIATWPWYGNLVKGLLYDAGEFLSVHEYQNVIRWADEIARRPAVKRGRLVNRGGNEGVLERHSASDFAGKI
jgi:GST-like protein